MTKMLAVLALVLGTLPCASKAAAPSPDVVAALAPSGRLRVAINYGNPVLAQKDPATGQPRGVSAALAKRLAERLGIGYDFVTFDGAGKVFDALKGDAWDLAFLAIDPTRAEGIDFTPPYVEIEGTYLVPTASPLAAIKDFDHPGIRIAVGRGSAYDLYLSRALKAAQLVRAPTSAEAIRLFQDEKLEAAAGVKQPLVDAASHDPALRVIPGRFMAIEQAMGVPRGRPLALAYVRDFIEEMKASGFVAEALAASGQTDASVAPPAKP